MDNDNRRARLYYLFGTTQTLHGSPWLARIPAGLFAIPLGLFGLAAAWRRTVPQWPLAADIGTLLLWVATTVWAVALLLYAFKCQRHWRAVLYEFRHPVQGPLQSLLPLSTLLLIIHFGEPSQGIWLLLALAVLGANGVIAGRIVHLLVLGRMPANAVTPALYLPLVGGALIGAMACQQLACHQLAVLLFGAGLAGWAVLEARVLNNLFQGPIPEHLRPTIGIELAPPPVAALAAALLWPNLPGDTLTIALGIALAPAVGLLARYRWWSDTPFSLGFWSFSFPLAALAALVAETAARNGWPHWTAVAALICASAAIVSLTIRTLVLLAKGKLLPEG